MSRKHGLRAVLGAAACAALSALGVASWTTAGAADAAEGYSPEISVAELMDSMVMPAAQALWDAVGVDVTAQGQVEKKPETDEQWAALRAAAVTLAEAANALIVPGRHAAPVGAPAPDPDSGLVPAADRSAAREGAPGLGTRTRKCCA